MVALKMREKEVSKLGKSAPEYLALLFPLRIPLRYLTAHSLEPNQTRIDEY